MLELKKSEDILCDVCGEEAISKIADSREHKQNKKIGLALCSQCLKKLNENIQNR